MDGVKTCFKCGKEKALSEFYRHSEMADGYLNKCKACAKADVSANYNSRREQYSEYDKRRGRLPHRVAQRKECQRRTRAKNPEKDKARAALHRAVRAGRVVKPSYCTVCGRECNPEAHHADYSKALDVLWLCFVCHREYGHGQKVTQTDFEHKPVKKTF